MSNSVFPALTGLTFPVEKTPIWSTKVQTAVSGKETRLGFWTYPIWQYSINYSFLRSDNVNAELQSLVGFYNAHLGSFDSWLFNDPDDNLAVDQNFGTGDSATTLFQLARSYGGSYEPVKAVQSVTNVKINGATTAAYTLDTSTGLITFTTPPIAGAVLTWSGAFYWRCRFLDDQMTVSKFMAQLWETQTLKFQSIK